MLCNGIERGWNVTDVTRGWWEEKKKEEEEEAESDVEDARIGAR